MNVLIEGDSLNTVVVLNYGSSCGEVVGLSLYVVIALTFINPLPLMASVEGELHSFTVAGENLRAAGCDELRLVHM